MTLQSQGQVKHPSRLTVVPSNLSGPCCRLQLVSEAALSGRAVHGWVVSDEMCECWNVLSNVSMSFPGHSHVNYAKEMRASPRHEKSSSDRMRDSTSRMCLWVDGDFASTSRSLKFLKLVSRSEMPSPLSSRRLSELGAQEGEGSQNRKLQGQNTNTPQQKKDLNILRLSNYGYGW